MNAITTTAPQTFSLVPSSFDEALKISATLAKSELVPKDFRNKPENVFVAIAWGQEIGLQPLQSLQNIAVINGRPAIWGDAALAVVMAHPDFIDIIEEAKDGTAFCTVKRKNRSPVVRAFTQADAQKAGLIGKQGPWTQYPDRMKQMRARGFALRDAFPDAMKGIRLAEEVQDIEEHDITPAASSIVMPRERQETAAADPQSDPAPQQHEQLRPQESAAAQAAEGELTLAEGQIRMITKKAQEAGVDLPFIAMHFGVERIEQIAISKANEALAFIKKSAPT